MSLHARCLLACNRGKSGADWYYGDERVLCSFIWRLLSDAVATVPVFVCVGDGGGGGRSGGQGVGGSGGQRSGAMLLDTYYAALMERLVRHRLKRLSDLLF